MDKLILHEDAQQMIWDDALNTYPHECCGFLYGSDDDDRLITQAIEVNNTREENRERRFEISAQDYLKAELYADENNLTLLGVYHSHPDHPAVPSEYDLRHALPYFSYIIVSVKRGKAAQLNSWKLDSNGQFEQEAVEVRRVPFNVDNLLANLYQ